MPDLDLLHHAFHLIDHDRDGVITEPDLCHIFASLGTVPPQDMGAPRPPITLPMFLAMMSERLSQFDPAPDLAEAFASFDDADTGLVKADDIRKWLADVGERMDQHEIDKLLKSSFTDRHGNFNYREWIKALSVHGGADEPGQS